MTRRERSKTENKDPKTESALQISEQVVSRRARWFSMSDRKMIAHYNKHWPGVTRGKLQKLSKEAESFYRAAYRRPRVLEVIPRVLNDWQAMTDEEMVTYCHTKWPNVSRGMLPSLSKEANGFYQAALRRPHVLDAIERERIDWTSMSDEQMIEHYNVRWSGISRGKLQILSNDSCAFYIAAYKRPQVLAVIPRIKQDWASMSDEQMIEHCNKNWPGVSRGALYRHSKESKAFYKAAKPRPNVFRAIPTRASL